MFSEQTDKDNGVKAAQGLSPGRTPVEQQRRTGRYPTTVATRGGGKLGYDVKRLRLSVYACSVSTSRSLNVRAREYSICDALICKDNGGWSH